MRNVDRPAQTSLVQSLAPTCSSFTSPKAKGPVSRPLLDPYCDRGTCGPAGGCGLPAARREAGRAPRRPVRPAACPALPARSATGRPGVEDRARLAVHAGENRQDQAGGKEHRRQDRGRAGQHVGGAAARQETAAAAAAMPRPPPSDFCSRTRPIMASTIMRWMTMMTVCISRSAQAPSGPEGPLLDPSYRNSERSLHDPPAHFHPARGVQR